MLEVNIISRIEDFSNFTLISGELLLDGVQYGLISAADTALAMMAEIRSSRMSSAVGRTRQWLLDPVLTGSES
jgi:hypothetical protein